MPVTSALTSTGRASRCCRPAKARSRWLDVLAIGRLECSQGQAAGAVIIIELAGHDIERSNDRRQQVVEVVRHSSRQLANGFELLQLVELRPCRTRMRAK
jgi:hypothetical protein